MQTQTLAGSDAAGPIVDRGWVGLVDDDDGGMVNAMQCDVGMGSSTSSVQERDGNEMNASL